MELKMSEIIKQVLSNIENLFEMTNIPYEIHKIKQGIKLNVLQPGDTEIPHGPRVKVFKGNIQNNYYVDLNEDVNKIKIRHYPKDLFLSKKEEDEMLAHIKEFRVVNIPMYKNLHTDILISHLIETTPEVPSVCYKFFKSPQ